MDRKTFIDFSFDMHTFNLTRNQKACRIRPKTAHLLALFLSNPNRLLTKEEIFEAIWGKVQVQDHVLFQVISEIRKLKPEAELIRTQPNAGYVWVAPVLDSKRLKPKHLLATCLTLALVGAGAFYNVATSPVKPSLLPALSAYSKGIQALDNGDAEQAIEMFHFALTQNPSSEEAALLLAESLFQAKQFEAAQVQVQKIQQNAIVSNYTQLAITDLQSRIYAQRGEVKRATDTMLHGMEDRQQIAQCTIETIEKRLASYSTELTGSQSLGGVFPQADSKQALALADGGETGHEVSSACKELNSRIDKEFRPLCEDTESLKAEDYLVKRVFRTGRFYV